MKSFEQTLTSLHTESTDLLMVLLFLHYKLKHLESSNTYVRILFMDFSSVFNTINPVKPFLKLLDMNNDPCIHHWIHNFLWNMQQRAREGHMQFKKS